MHTLCQLILRKISKVVAIRRQIANVHHIRLPLGPGGAYSAPLDP